MNVDVKQTGLVAVTSMVPAWTWRCGGCGWVGTGHTSENAALREASTHAWEDHHFALCASVDGEKQIGHPGHVWRHLNFTDGVDKCDRCEEMIGK